MLSYSNHPLYSIKRIISILILMNGRREDIMLAPKNILTRNMSLQGSNKVVKGAGIIGWGFLGFFQKDNLEILWILSWRYKIYKIFNTKIVESYYCIPSTPLESRIQSKRTKILCNYIMIHIILTYLEFNILGLLLLSRYVFCVSE